MLAFVGRRLIAAIPLVWGIATIVFLLVQLAPGDAADFYVSTSMSDEVRETIRAQMGLDQPLAVQYARWLRGVVTLDLGYSLTTFRPVSDVLLAALPATLLLSGCALALAFLVGIVVGTIQAMRQYGLVDSALSVVLLFFYSMPSFWLALMLLLTFGLYANQEWPFSFPVSGMMSLDYASMSLVERVLDRLYHLVLPTVSLALVLIAGIARFVRGSMLEVVRQDFVRTARAKGLRERTVVFKHALRNALGPVVTLLGLYLPFLFSGAVFVEVIFSWPGMGRAIVAAIGQRDLPIVMAGSFFFALVVVAANLLADVLYAVVDPRIRYD